MKSLKDNFFRAIDYLRLSIGDRCNLRCIYCMPSDGIAPSKHGDILSYEEIIRIVKISAELGVNKIRITGGEPLIRKNISFLINSIKNIAGIEDLSMTTNGILLDKYAQELADAGLDRVNVSVDSLVPERYKAITRGGSLDTVLRGLDAAEKAGLFPLKINMVPVKGINDDEILDFAKLTLGSKLHVRFIELMPSGSVDFWKPGKYLTTDEIRSAIESLGQIVPVKLRKNGPAKYYRIEGAEGVVGFISALTHHFCEDCNRIRLTADGKIRPCLFSETEIDLKSPLRNKATDSEIERLLKLSVEIKPKEHNLNAQNHSSNINNQKNVKAALIANQMINRPMSKIGG
jgi:cyclic pyranopterin phosphate synthase